jgi:hypothetical protein
VPRIAYILSKNSCCFVPAKPEEHIGNSHKLSQIERPVRLRLSLFQREKMKVRVCFAVAPRVRTRLLARRYRVLCEPDDSRIATQ